MAPCLFRIIKSTFIFNTNKMFLLPFPPEPTLNCGIYSCGNNFKQENIKMCMTIDVPVSIWIDMRGRGCGCGCGCSCGCVSMIVCSVVYGFLFVLSSTIFFLLLFFSWFSRCLALWLSLHSLLLACPNVIIVLSAIASACLRTKRFLKKHSTESLQQSQH